jgi:hypothetical protein
MSRLSAVIHFVMNARVRVTVRGWSGNYRPLKIFCGGMQVYCKPMTAALFEDLSRW